jgi:hypothetical protein
VGDGGLSETNTNFARYVDSLLENTDIKIAIDDTDAAALFKKYGWTLDYQISAMITSSIINYPDRFQSECILLRIQ